MASLPDRSPFTYGVLALGVASFTVSPILVRLASEAPGLTIAVWRTSLATLFLAPVALPRIGPEIRALERRDVLLIVAAGVLLGLHFITWIESLYHTTVASASVLVTTSPIFLAAFGYAVLGERLSTPTVLAILGAVGGAVLIGAGDAGAVTFGGGALWGNSLALLASLLVTFYLLIGRVVRQKVSWTAYVFPLYAVAAVTTGAVALLQGTPLTGFGWGFYGLCALMALGPQIVGHGSFNYALQYFPAALVGMLALLEPVGASVLAYALFGEVPTLLACIGMFVVLASVSVVVWVRRTRKAPAAHPQANQAS